MQFNIFRDGAGFTLTDGDTTIPGFASEDAAADVAIRSAQDRDALYTINYWRP